MKTRFQSAALAAAAVVLATASPVSAVEIPDQHMLLVLKDHPDLPLTWTENGAAFVEGGETTWRVVVHDDPDGPRDSRAELEYEGAVQVVLDETGQCLASEPMPLLGARADVTLAECDSTTWWIMYADNRPSHHDLRIVDPEGHMLGARSNNLASGDPAYVFDVDESEHNQEWRFRRFAEPEPQGDPEADPPEQADPVAQVPPADPADPADLRLPVTGPGLAAAGAAALGAVAAGAGLLAWWRRRVLRVNW